jgi:hypothetical protein
MGPTRPLIPCVPEALFPAVKQPELEADHLTPSNDYSHEPIHLLCLHGEYRDSSFGVIIPHTVQSLVHALVYSHVSWFFPSINLHTNILLHR